MSRSNEDGAPRPGERGLDLHLDLRGPRVRTALEAALRDAVRSGRLAGGSLMPSSRSLASDLGIARNTVVSAYTQLVAEGWLTSRPGAGTHVAADLARLPHPIPERAPAEPQPRYDLTPGPPDVSKFPRAAWAAAAKRAMAAAPSEAFGYGDPRGRPELREVLAEYLARARGVTATPAQVIVCSGSVQGLSLLCTAMGERRTPSFAVESIGFRLHRRVLEARDAAMVPLTVDADGACTAELSRTDAEVALLTPAHQYPTGVALAPERRAEAIGWARERDALVVEDDYDGEFRYDAKPIGALQSLDPERVVYLGTASKALAPGLRLAWMVVPPRLVEPLVSARKALDIHTGVFEQLTMAELIRSGDYDRTIRRSRLTYRRRRDQLVSMLARQAPQVEVTGLSAGLHALLYLPGALEHERRVVREARARGLELRGLEPLRLEPRESDRAGLVVGYGTPPGHAYSGALTALAQVLDLELDHGRGPIPA